jgi:hypothetical protein
MGVVFGVVGLFGGVAGFLVWRYRQTGLGEFPR